ncbi:hypothetical protein E0704_04220 [Lactobacillus helveticus]|nr:hypothetical protein [Lactobacillus helveticus]
MVNTILKEADLFCPNSVRINFTIYCLNIIRFLSIIPKLIFPEKKPGDKRRASFTVSFFRI